MMLNSFLSAAALAAIPAATAPAYNIYAGNIHAHSAYTWSHGDMLDKGNCAGVRLYVADPSGGGVPRWTSRDPGRTGCSSMIVINGYQYHGPEVALRPGWQDLQGPPSAHFAAARAAGFDWYAVTDHSQEGGFSPPGSDNPLWLATKKQAEEATKDDFVGFAGFEYSENDGPGGTGHFNVINSASIKNALLPGVDLAAFYAWLASAAPHGEGPLVVSFNHPTPDSFDAFRGRTAAATEIIALMELINHDTRTHEDAFIAALDAGWKVSPVAGLDNHGLSGIAKGRSRTFVLAEEKSKVALLRAMRLRRTYAAFDPDLECRYWVNGAIMGSTLDRPELLRFDIRISRPDDQDKEGRIARVEIVTDGGEIVSAYAPPEPASRLRWTPQIRNSSARYFYVRLWRAGTAGPDKSSTPVAWLAPVWTGRESSPEEEKEPGSSP